LAEPPKGTPEPGREEEDMRDIVVVVEDCSVERINEGFYEIIVENILYPL
jgi:hypothetical protein